MNIEKALQSYENSASDTYNNAKKLQSKDLAQEKVVQERGSQLQTVEKAVKPLKSDFG